MQLGAGIYHGLSNSSNIRLYIIPTREENNIEFGTRFSDEVHLPRIPEREFALLKRTSCIDRVRRGRGHIKLDCHLSQPSRGDLVVTFCYESLVFSSAS